MNNDQYIDYINYIKSYHKSLNNAIMEVFMNNNISYIQAAALLGVNSSMMTKYTTAESKFTLEHVLQCSLFFRIPPSEFLRGCENMDCFAFSWDKFIGIRDEHIAYIKKMYTGKPQSIDRGEADFLKRKMKLLQQCANANSEIEIIKIKLNLALQKLRMERGISQQDLVNIIGINKRTISILENGIVEFTWIQLVRYALAIGVNPADVFSKVDYNWDNFIRKDLALDINDVKASDLNWTRNWRDMISRIDI